MAFTDRSDLFVSIHENGINQVLQHVLHQRPSTFNYGTALVARNKQLLCAPIDPAPAVTAKNNPLLTIVDPLPLVGSDPLLGLNFVLQITRLEVDFAPGNVIALPPELNPLGQQRFALHGQVCGGLGCPNEELIRRLEDLMRQREEQKALEEQRRAALAATRAATAAANQFFSGAFLSAQDFADETQYLAGRAPNDTGRIVAQPDVRRPPIPIPTDRLLCFCLDFFAVGHLETISFLGKPALSPRLDGFEIVDLRPEGLEDSIECYISTLVRVVLLPKVHVELEKLFPVSDLFTLTAFATPTSAALPFNPAIEDNQAKAFINISVGPPPPPSPPGPPGPPAPTRNINWSAPFPPGPGGAPHLIAAASEGAVGKIFGGVRDNFKKTASDTKTFGPFSAGYDIEIVLENGDVELNSDGTIKLDELDVKFNKLKFFLGFDIPGFCIGGQCIIPTPFGCALRLPKFCVFGDNPDIELALDLAPLVRLEFSLLFRLLTKYGIEVTRPAGMLDVDALAAGIPNLWGIFLKSITVDVDLFDIADIVGDILESAVETAINDLLPGPQWVKDAILAILGPIIDLIRAILDIPDDIQEWLSDLLGVSLGLLDFIANLLINHFGGGSPLLKLEDPFPAAPATSSGLVPILIPIRDLNLTVNDTELALRASVGA